MPFTPNAPTPPIATDSSGHLNWWNGTSWIQLANTSDIPAQAVTPAPAPAPAPAPLPATPTPVPLAATVAFPGAEWTIPAAGSAIDVTWTTNFTTTFGTSGIHLDGGVQYGIPINTVDSTVTKLVVVSVDQSSEAAPSESDLVLVPIPENPVTESGSDLHLIIRDSATGFWYEMYHATLHADGTWHCDSLTAWDEQVGSKTRPFNFTSGDAGGMPIGTLLAAYDQFANPVSSALNGATVQTLGHALRITMAFTRAAYYADGDPYGGMIFPATHSAPTNSGCPAVMGQRVILRPDYDTSALKGAQLILANTLKVYGAIIADNGSSGYLSATTDPRWTDDMLANPGIDLKDFQVVAFSTVYSSATPNLSAVNADLTGKVVGPPAGTQPTITFANGQATITNGTHVYIQGGTMQRSATFAVASGQTVVADNLYGRVTAVAP